MPKLYWRAKNEEVLPRGGGLGSEGSLTPGGSQPVVWLTEETSPELFKLNTNAPNFTTASTFDEALDTFRQPQVNNGHIARKNLTNGHIITDNVTLNSHIGKNGFNDGPQNGLRNGHSRGRLNGISNGIYNNISNEMTNGITNGMSNGRSNGMSNGLIPLSIQGRSVFDTEADDIVKMAAQRDQNRFPKGIRGMMAPVMSKEDDASNRSASRLHLTKQRSESVLSTHEPLVYVDRKEHRDDIIAHAMLRRTGNGHSGVSMRDLSDYLEGTGSKMDITVQAGRRQSLRGSRQNLMETSYAPMESNPGSRMSMGTMGTVSPDEFMVFRGDGKDYIPEEGESLNEVDRRKTRPRLFPSSHEDIQILNLQGFMDNPAVGGNDSGASTSRRRHKKRRSKRNDLGNLEISRETFKFGSKSKDKRKKNRSMGRSTHSDDDDEMTLKDIDDLDHKVAGLVLGPKSQAKDPSGEAITLELASELRNMLTGSPSQVMPTDWMNQNFKHNTNPNLSYGLVQKKGGPCGVLACVQSLMMKSLIYGSSVSPNVSPVSPLRPSHREWSWSLATAITEILWRAGQERRAVLALPGSFIHFTDHGVGRYTRDGVTETLTIYEFIDLEELYQAVQRHLTVFTTENNPGCFLLLCSALLSRGLENVLQDMDSGGGHLINAHGYSSQEIINLFLTGIASTNTFDGDHTLGDNPSQSVHLRGVHYKSDIGLLSLFEHYNCYKVGNHLKSPAYPIWVVCCESHFSCLFSRDSAVTSDRPTTPRFDIYYYDGLALQEDEIRLSIDLEGDISDQTIIPPLEHCIRTKWKGAGIEWNGTDPIL